MKCDDYRGFVFDYLDGTLPDRAAFEEHGAACPDCAAILRGIRANEEVLARAGVPAAPPDLWPRIAAAIPRRREARFHPMRWVAALAAAAALIAALGVHFASAPAPRLDFVVVDAGPALDSLMPDYDDADTAGDAADAPAPSPRTGY